MASSVLSREKPIAAASPRPTTNVTAAALLLGAGTAALALGATIAWQPYQLVVTRVSIVAVAVVIGGLATARWGDTARLLRRIFWARDSATNLAILRVATFATLWWLLGQVSFPVTMASREFWDVPQSIRWLFALIPPGETLVYAGAAICKALCLLGVFGVFTRTSAALSALLGTYILGTTQCWHVAHFHHVIWFLLILAVARSSDRLSLAAPFRTAPTSGERSLDYGVPMRFVWFLIGTIYFFPGLAKLWNIGVDWIWTDNLPNMIVTKTFAAPTVSSILQAVPIMQVWQIAALCVILFECLFIVLVFMGENVRCGLAGAAILFHQTNGILMKIPFYHLQPFLLLLLNWHRIFVLAGKRIFGRRLAVRFNPTCKKCLSTESAIRQFDLYRQILPTHADCAAATIDFHGSHYDPSALTRVLMRAPLALVAIACCYVRYGQVDQRVGKVPSRVPMPLLPLAIGSVLVVVEWTCGFTDRNADWPFASYPLFATRIGDQMVLHAAELEKPDGTYASKWLCQSVPGLTNLKLRRILMRANSGGPLEERRAMQFLCRLAVSTNPQWEGVKSVHIFKKSMRAGLEHPRGELVRSEHVYSFSREELLPSPHPQGPITMRAITDWR